MGLLSKYITTKLTESVIKTVGKVTLETTVGIMEQKAKQEKESQKSQTEKTPSNIQNEVKIKPPRIDELIGKHYLKVRAAFIGAGFEDISFIVKKDIIKGWLRKDGEVSEISINGRSEIGNRAKFLPSAPVVIVYHTFRDSL